MAAFIQVARPLKLPRAPSLLRGTLSAAPGSEGPRPWVLTHTHAENAGQEAHLSACGREHQGLGPVNWTPAQVQRTGRFPPALSWVTVSMVFWKISFTPPHRHRSEGRSHVQAPTESQGPAASLPGPLGSAACAHRRGIRQGHGNSACHGRRSLLPRHHSGWGCRVCVCVCVCVCVQSCTSCARMGGGRHKQGQFTLARN